MKAIQLKSKIENLSREEQLSQLAGLGFPKEQANDYLNWLLAPRRQPEQLKQKPMDRMEQAMSRLAERLETFQTSPTPQPGCCVDAFESRELSVFERNVLTNRFILGGESIFDGASLHNPALQETQVIRWYRDVFAPSQSRFALVLGGTGSGKTWGTMAYAASIAQVTWSGGGLESDRYVSHVNVGFVKAHRLADMVANLRKFQDELDKLSKRKILIIDDFGCEPPGFRGADFLAHFENLVNERHMYRRTTLMTANLRKADFKEMYGERVVSRFNELGLFKETTDPDFRVWQDPIAV